MNAVYLILFAALVSCASAQIYPETPAQRELREKEERAWAKTISSRYDHEALLAFLKQTIAEKKSWRGIDLTKPRLDAKWTTRGQSMISGDWSFLAHDPNKDDFTFSFLDRDHWLILKCARNGKKNFRVVEITTEKLELVVF